MKWYEEANFYQIYPLGMLGAEEKNNYDKVTNRLIELNDWIDHLKKIGVNAIYIGPLFESSTHGYDTTDYKKVDCRLGDNQSFVDLVKKYHENGIKVVVDGVFNHTGRDFFAFQDLKRLGEKSKYKDWYVNVDFKKDSVYNDHFYYEGWRGCYELAKLNLKNPEVRSYLLEVIHDWIREFQIDGIRLDCADLLEFSFLEEMREATSKWKKDFWLMGEVIHGDYSEWVNEKRLHSVTNYEMHKGIYSSHNDYNYYEVAYSANRQFNKEDGIYRDGLLYTFVDNHDVDRLASKLVNPEHIYNCYTLLYTLPGIPSIYNGSEWGMKGKKEGEDDSVLRPKLSIKNVKIDLPALPSFIKALSDLRKQNKVLVDGEYEELYVDNRQYAFARGTGKDSVIVVLNNDEQDSTIVISLEKLQLKEENLQQLFGEVIHWEAFEQHLEVTIAACRGAIFCIQAE